MQQYVGMRLGRYQIVEQIGQGGMATVCKAYQPSMDRYVAIKILPSHFTEDESFVGRFTQEARTLARLEHPHILPVYDYGEQDGITYLVMRYVEAGTLKDLIHREGPIDLQEAARIVGQVAAALACGHSQGVIHRDIKPSNVLIDQYGNTFLTDFGIAKLVAETAQFTASGAVIGTPAYMSPEQGMGQPVDARSDIYSLGVVLYELVTGRVPFQAETPLAVLLKHLNAPLPPPRQIQPDLPPAVERVILKAMAKSPDDRCQTARELAAALDQAVVDATQERARPQPLEDQIEETLLRPRPSPPPPVVAPEALSEQQRRAELDHLYGQAVEAMDAGQWAQARDLLAQIQEQEPGYRGAERLLDRADAELEQAEADRQRWEVMASLYEEAQNLAQDRQWGPALAKMDEIRALDPEFADPEGIAAWAGEQAAAEEAAAERQRREQNELAALYDEAKRLARDRQWGPALAKMDEIRALDPEFDDPEGIAAQAREQAAAEEAEAERQRREQNELAALYDEAQRLARDRQWGPALAKMDEIRALDPEFDDPEGIAAQAREQAAAEEAEAERQRREQNELAALYEEAQSLARDRQWGPALAKMDEILALDAEFDDPEGIALWAREQAAAEEAEAERQRREQNELASLYEEAVRLLKAGQYQQALQKWDDVQAIDPGYRDHKKVQSKARKKLARLTEPAAKRRPPRWIWIAAGTVAVAAIAVAAVLLLGALSTAPPTPRGMPTDLGAGTVWKWSDGSAMVYVPGGEFWMGTDEAEPEANPDERPQHLVGLDAFWIDRTEVTNAQYERCVKDEGCSPPAEATAHIYGDYYGESQYDDYPVIHVNWGQANAYCAWAGKRLPTEAEWEKAARGTDKRRYPWGNTFDGSLANFCDANCPFDHKDSAWDDGYASTAPVGSYEGGTSPYGALDMAGNVHEWTSSLDRPYPYNAMDDREDPDAPDPRVVRGGSFGAGWPGVRTASSEVRPPAHVSVDVGFRCVQSAQLSPAAMDPSRTVTQTPEVASIEAHRELGVRLLEQGEYEGAVAQFDQALALGPETADLYYLRAEACSQWYHSTGRCSLDQAIGDVSRAIELDGTNPIFWFARGIYHLDLADPLEALSNLDKAVELDPDLAVAWAERGSALAALGELDGAVESFERAIGLDPQECIAYRGLAEVYRDQGQYDPALAACTRALERCPHLDSIHIVRGQIYLDQIGDAAQALSDFDQAIQIAPDTAPYYYERGRAHAQIGHVDEARADFETYLRLAEGDPRAEYREEVEHWLAEN